MLLTKNAKALLKVLVNYLDTARPGHPQTYPTYKQVAADLGFHNISGRIGLFLQPRGLDELAEWTKRFGVPAITGLIVLQEELVPGEGYFDLFGKSGTSDMYDWWKEEIQKSKEYDPGLFTEACSAFGFLGVRGPGRPLSGALSRIW